MSGRVPEGWRGGRKNRKNAGGGRRAMRWCAWSGGGLVAAFLLAWGIALAGSRLGPLAEAFAMVSAAVRPVIRVAGAVALLGAVYVAFGNGWVLLGRVRGKAEEASYVAGAGALLGAFANWAAPEGGVWKMVAGAIVTLDPGTWVAVRELGKLVLRGRDDRDPRDGRDGESVVEGGKAGGTAGARRDGDERKEVTR